MTRLALRWIATRLLANSAAIRSLPFGAQLGQVAPPRARKSKPSAYPDA